MMEFVISPYSSVVTACPDQSTQPSTLVSFSRCLFTIHSILFVFVLHQYIYFRTLSEWAVLVDVS